jgi:flavodoxin/ferredoxin
MRILIVYFSGTGNTARIAEDLQREFQAQNAQCEILPMEQVTQAKVSLDIQAWDLIGIGFPVHAMDAPQIVYDFLELLPQCRKNYFLFKTAGSAFLQGGSTRRLREKLAFKGLRLSHEQLYVMPPNAFGTANQSKVDKRYYQSLELVKRSAGEILAGIKHRVPEAPLAAACYAFAGLEKHGAAQASKRWQVNEDCNLCGLCAKQCPTENIRIEEGKITFGDSCLLCLRCWWNCPQRAISHSFLKPFFLKEPYQLPLPPY